MEELIKVNYSEDKALVSAGELHKFLEIKKHLTQWIKPYIKEENDYGFTENVDFTRIDGEVNPTNGIPTQEFALTIEMAKELSMLSKSPKGKEARKYFIECEKRLKEVVSKPVLPEDYLSALKDLVASEEEKALMKPKVEYYENVLNPETYIKLLTTSEVAKDLHMSAQILHKRLNELGIIYKQKKTWMFYSKYQDRVPEYADYTINEHSQTLKWTEKGREWIIKLINENE